MGWVGGWGHGPVRGMAEGGRAEELLGVVGTDESTSTFGSRLGVRCTSTELWLLHTELQAI